MSKVKIQGNASGTGVVTLTAPNTNTDRTITLPDSSDTLVSTAPSTSGNILTSDGTNWTSAAPAAAGADTSLSNLSATGENRVAQAWINFNGEGTVAIRDSHNISSITDNGVGIYTVNYSNNMGNANYSIAGMAEADGKVALRDSNYAAYHAVGSCRVAVKSGGTYIDREFVSLQIFGD